MNDLERKIELFNGHLVTGRRPEGTLGLLQLLLQSWESEKIFGLASSDQWQQALQQPVNAGEIENRFDLFNVVMADWKNHYSTLQDLRFGLSTLERSCELESWSYGFVMKLGQDVVMPDLYVGTLETNRVHEYHYAGPPELLIEVLRSDTRDYDLEQQITIYQRHQVPEIWLVDPIQKNTVVYRLTGNETYQRTLETQLIECQRLPIILDLAVLFDETEHRENPFQSRGAKNKRRRFQANEVLGWTKVESLNPTCEVQKVNFDQFMTYVPEVKFEGSNQRLEVGGGGWETTRDLLQLLLYHVGLNTTVSLMTRQQKTELNALHGG
jgi:hypothetical protein